MAYYRLYFMEAFSGHIRRFEEFEVEGDAEAKALAEAKQGTLALELWCSKRKVARFESLDIASQLLAQRRAQMAVKASLEPDADEQTSGLEGQSA